MEPTGEPTEEPTEELTREAKLQSVGMMCLLLHWLSSDRS
jgi:hypothetical protein